MRLALLIPCPLTMCRQPLCFVPFILCGRILGHRLRWYGRTGKAQRLYRLWIAVHHRDLSDCCSLGMGRRLARSAGYAGLCRIDGRSLDRCYSRARGYRSSEATAANIIRTGSLTAFRVTTRYYRCWAYSSSGSVGSDLIQAAPSPHSRTASSDLWL